MLGLAAPGLRFDDRAGIGLETARRARDKLAGHVVLALEVARHAAPKMRPGGTLLLVGGTGGRRISRELGLASAATAVLPPFTAALALELAPVRVNLIAGRPTLPRWRSTS
jgi:short-subunit dehydrogenase